MIRAALILCLSAAAAIAHAAAPTDADFTAWAASDRWQALVHLNPGATLRDVGASYVDDPDFFLAASGKRDPRAELVASHAALSQPDAATICRFPARYRFLAERLDWPRDGVFDHCEEYPEWREKMPTGQLVLAFPAAYLNSPSSMFGHTLLRLDPEPDPDSTWLSRAINFGARVNPNENSLFYIWRGLGGGYPGHFSLTAYVEKIRDYAHLENRDIWEYALNLDADELDWLVRHLWELRNINFDYFFFDENCSFRLLELIKVARPRAPLIEDFRFAELPVNTVRTLYRAGLVTERRYRPSKANELEFAAASLSNPELALARQLVDDPAAAETPAFQSHPPDRRHRIARVAYQALRLESRDQARTDDVARHSLALLRVVQRNAAPPAPEPPEPAAPETGHGTELAQFGLGSRGGSDFVEAGYRLTYHDVLDPVTGFLRGAGIEGLDINLRLDEAEGLVLESLDLVNIRSLAPRGAFVKPTSWFVHGGLERVRADADGDTNDRRQALFLQGGPGATWRLGNWLVYGLATARAEQVSGAEPAVRLGAGPEFGALYQRPGWQLGLMQNSRWYQAGFARHRSELTLNLPVTAQDAIRLGCDYRDWSGGDEVGCRVAMRHFFD